MTEQPTRGSVPTRGIYVYINPDGSLGHIVKGEPTLNDAEIIGLGTYLSQLVTINETNKTRAIMAGLLERLKTAIENVAKDPTGEESVSESMPAESFPIMPHGGQ